MSIPTAMKMKKIDIEKLVSVGVVSKYSVNSGSDGMYMSVASGGIIDRTEMRTISPVLRKYFWFMRLRPFCVIMLLTDQMPTLPSYRIISRKFNCTIFGKKTAARENDRRRGPP